MKHARGFSLLETLVAAALFAAVATLAWGGLDTIVRGRQVLATEGAQWLSLARQIGRFERDLRQALPRPATVAGREQPALEGRADGLAATVWHPGDATAVERVQWRCNDGEFRRLRWPVVDRMAHTPATEPPGLVHTGCELHYYDQQGQRVTRWPPDGADPRQLPRAVEIRLRIAGRGDYRRLLELADSPLPVAP